MSVSTAAIVLITFWGAVFAREAWKRRRYYVASALVVLMAAGVSFAYTLNEVLYMKAHQIKGLSQATATTDAVAGGRTITAGTGMTGGGDFTSDRTLSVDQTYNFSWSGLHTWNPATTQSRAIYFDMNAIGGGAVDGYRDSHLLRMRSRRHVGEIASDITYDWNLYGRSNETYPKTFVITNSIDEGTAVDQLRLTRGTGSALGILEVDRLSLTTPLDITSGGTNAITASSARSNLACAPNDAKYITQVSNSELSAEQDLSALSSGIVKVTTGTGVLGTVTIGTGLDYTSGTLSVTSGGAAATAIDWRDVYKARVADKTSLTAGAGIETYSDTMCSSTLWTIRTGTGGANTQVVSSGCAEQFSITTSNGSVAGFYVAGAATQPIHAPGTGGKWYAACRIKYESSAHANQRGGCGYWDGGAAPATYMVGGIFGNTSTTKFVAEIKGTSGTTVTLTSGVNIDTSWHIHQIWRNATQDCYSVDDETAVCSSAANVGGGDGVTGAWILDSGGGTGNKQLDVDWGFWGFATAP